MEDLMIAPSSLARRSSFLLSDFQSSLSKAVAAVVWYGKAFIYVRGNNQSDISLPTQERNRNNTDVHSFDPSSTFNDQLLGQTAVEVGIIRIRLNVSGVMHWSLVAVSDDIACFTTNSSTSYRLVHARSKVDSMV